MRDLRGTCRRWLASNRGSVAVLFGLMIIPLFGMVGAAVDYSRATAYREELRKAADAAALAAAKQRNATPSDRQKVGEQVFFGNIAASQTLTQIAVKVVDIQNGVRVDASAVVTNSIISVVGFKTTPITTFAEALTSDGMTEVALVLDNTGSMRNDMTTLRDGATDFANLLFDSGGDGGQFRMALVPYVAAVNVGVSNMSMSWMDTGADSEWHGRLFRNEGIGEMAGCDSDPFPHAPAAASSNSGSKPVTPASSNSNASSSKPKPPKPPKPIDPGPSGNDRVELWRGLNMLARISVELFGVKSAHADVTAPTVAPYNPGKWVTPGAPYVKNGEKAWLPDGFQYDSPCNIRNPSKISYFDLFNRIPGTRWKGCVEARPEPFDVTDDPPSPSNVSTLFVPYFWPDEPGRYDDNSVYSNSYLDDTTFPQGWKSESSNFKNLFKYSGAGNTDIKETPPVTKGPNKACPTEVVPLTTSRSKVLGAISKIDYWGGGGTISSEGVMWGWRVLSPEPPFTEGMPYDPKNRKFIVLMSDGANSLVANNTKGPTKSDYTAYGYLRDGRFGTDMFNESEDYLNERMQLACENAKAKGIKIMTILFREKRQIAKDVMRNCATDPSMAYLAGNGNELRQAFRDIAAQIMTLRISR